MIRPASSVCLAASFYPTLDRSGAEIAALGRAADAPALAGRTPGGVDVVDGDERVDVSAAWLIAALTAAPAKPGTWPATRAALVRRLKSIGDESESAGDASRAQSRAQARAAVETILARERIPAERRQPVARDGCRSGSGSGSRICWGGSAPGAARLAARRSSSPGQPRLRRSSAWGSGWRGRSPITRAASPLGLGSGAAARPRARDLALRALAAARLGQTREAVRCAYGAALVRLEEQGVWRIDDARTPREYLPLLPGDRQSPLRSMLDLTRRFEQIWYGNRAAVADDARRVTDHLEALGCLRPGERAI